MSKYISELDTLRFGFKVAKINEFDDFDDSPANAIDKLRDDGVILIISRVLTSDIKLINKMEEVGFRLKDVQVTYSILVGDERTPEIPSSLCSYRGFKKKDTEDIVRIAADSFEEYGHYSNNERTASIGVSLIYKDWARRSCIGNDLVDHIVVAEIEGVVVGFLSLKIKNSNRLKYAVGVMGAVSREYRKDGIFQGINIASLRWAKAELIERIENNVLVTNFPVNKTYVSLGFNIIRSETTFHCLLG